MFKQKPIYRVARKYLNYLVIYGGVMNYVRNKLLLQKMPFDIMIFTTHENFFVKFYHNNLMAFGLSQIQISIART